MTLRICFFSSDKPREQLLADAFLMGARRHGHTTEVRALAEDVDVTGFDLACFVGVKSRLLQRRIGRTGAHFVMIDKGYSRHKSKGNRVGWEYWRVAIDAHHPTDRLADQHSPDDRMKALGWTVKPWREPGEAKPIIIAGSSAKYHDFYGLKDPTIWVKEVIRDLRAITERPLIYRPKPSWREARPVLKAAFSRLPETLDSLLDGAHAMVTHGSNACFEAVMAGVPCIVLGEGVAKPLSAMDLADIENPRLASDAERLQWAANLACWQWTEGEMASGAAWDFIGEQLHQGG